MLEKIEELKKKRKELEQLLDAYSKEHDKINREIEELRCYWFDDNKFELIKDSIYFNKKKKSKEEIKKLVDWLQEWMNNYQFDLDVTPTS